MINLIAASWHKRLFFYAIGLICLTYGIFEYSFIPYGSFAADEFVFARHIYEHTLHIPYLDFQPYKSTLGHYLLAIPLFFSHDVVNALFYMKGEIALLNILFISLVAYLSLATYNKTAIVMAILAVIANQAFIVHSSELRVDLLTAWACLFSLISLLKLYPRLAGALLGLAFLVSQKALWYFIAINAGLVICWLAFEKPTYSIKTIVQFNLYVIATIFSYLVFWSCIAGPRIVLTNFFYDAYVQAGINLYAPAYTRFWRSVLSYGPFLFFFWPLAVFCLLIQAKNSAELQRQVFIAAVSTILLLLFINYKQAFPYNFVFTVPAFYLLYVEFFNWLFATHPEQAILKKRWHQITIPIIGLLFAALLGALIYDLKLFFINYLSVLVPIAISIYLIDPQQYPPAKKMSVFVIVTVFALNAIVAPSVRAINTSAGLTGEYQRINIRLANELLKQGGTYLSGMPFVYGHDQPIRGLKNLIMPQISYLKSPDAAIAPLLLDSLYLSPITLNEALNELHSAPIKFFVNNYRLLSLPKPIWNYLADNYKHYYGSIYIYAPKVGAGIQSIQVKFSGYYAVTGKLRAFINMDGTIIKTNGFVRLTAGKHLSSSLTAYRLTLIPKRTGVDLPKWYYQDRYHEMFRSVLY